MSQDIDIQQEIDHRWIEYRFKRNDLPKMIYLMTDEFISMLRSEASYEANRYSPVERAEGEYTFRGAVVRCFTPQMQHSLTSLLTNEQLTLWLVDQDLDLRNLAYQTLKQRNLD